MQTCRAHLANFAFCTIPMNLSNLYSQTILLETICPAVVSKPEILIIMTPHVTICSSCSPSNFTNCVSLFFNLAHLGNFGIVQFLCHQIPFAQTCLTVPIILQPTFDVQCNCTRIINVLVPLVC